MVLSNDGNHKHKISNPAKKPVTIDPGVLAKKADIRNNLIEAIKKYSLNNHSEHKSRKDMIASDKLGKDEWRKIKSVFEGKKTHSERLKDMDQRWMIIEDKSLTQIILEAFGDEDKKKILTAIINEPRPISVVLDMCNIPQTSGYRKINSLIDNGLIIPVGFVTTSDGKKISTYVSMFENIKIDIIKNKVIVKAKFGKDSFATLKMVYSSISSS